MFQLPINEESYETTYAHSAKFKQKLHRRLVRDEHEELRQVDNLKNCSLVIPRKRAHTTETAKNFRKSDPVVDGSYIGLRSNTFYDHTAIEKIKSESVERDEGTDDDTEDSELEDEPISGPDFRSYFQEASTTSGYYKSYLIQKADLVELPRPPTKLIHVEDSPITEKVLEDSKYLSNRTLSILNRKKTKYGTPKLSEDSDQFDARRSYLVSIKNRQVSVMNSIIYFAILRGDFPTASQAFSILLRTPGFNIRLMWNVALELLVWRRKSREEIRLSHSGHSLPYELQTSKASSNTKTEDDDFLVWLSMNYPWAKFLSHQQSRTKLRSDDFDAYWIMSKLKHSDPKSAMGKLDDLLFQVPYSEMPIYHFLAGVATIQLAREKRNKSDGSLDIQEMERYQKKAKDYFDACLKFGGAIPEDSLAHELQAMVIPDITTDSDIDLAEDEKEFYD